MPGLYSVCLKLADRPCLVVGGGEVAERKIKTLLAAGAQVTVVAHKVTDTIRELAGKGLLRIHNRNFTGNDIPGSFLVIAATDDKGINSAIAKLAHKERVLVNVVDSPEESDFYVPSSFHRGDLTLSVSTNGKVPALSKKIREQLESQYGPEYGHYVTLLEKARKRIYRSSTVNEAARRELIKGLLNIDFIALLREGNNNEAECVMEDYLREHGL
ncbi:MAG: bifunctional precorrin-2 dehydrogenase/sirohydrochlorin ferrochelatase [Proteobacteria bacterium]|nr:bifunctional precorrin-2 dehydrogenase/sirohydrochlorin ferrochelatase [Pseudomonadota bacterium]